MNVHCKNLSKRVMAWYFLVAIHFYPTVSSSEEVNMGLLQVFRQKIPGCHKLEYKTLRPELEWVVTKEVNIQTSKTRYV